VQRIEYDSAADGSIDLTEYYQYQNGRLISRDIDTNKDQIPDFTRTTTFDNLGHFSGYIEYNLSESGEQQGVTANVVVSYLDNSLVISDRDFIPLGSPDVRVEYMTLQTGEITTSTETYYMNDGLTSLTNWYYENNECDTRWMGSVFSERCVDSAVN